MVLAYFLGYTVVHECSERRCVCGGGGLQHTAVKIALVLHGIFLPVMMDPRNLLVE